MFESTILYALYLLYMTSKLHFRNTKQHWVAAAILAPFLLITVPVTAFILAGYIGSEIPRHFPSGSYKEVLNVRQVTDRKLFDAVAPVSYTHLTLPTIYSVLCWPRVATSHHKELINPGSGITLSYQHHALL